MTYGFRLAAVMFAVLALGGLDAQSAFFDPLFRLTKVVGDVKVYKPGATEPVPAVENYAYPYGTRVVVGVVDPKAKLPKGAVPVVPEVMMLLSRDHMFRVGTGSDITVSHGDDGDNDKKVLSLAEGKITTFITVTTAKTGGAIDAQVEALYNAITIRTPVADCVRVMQSNEITVKKEGDSYSCVIASGSGNMDVNIPQCQIRELRRRSALEIFGNRDFSRITCLAGQFTGLIERGSDPVERVDFKVRTLAKIWRSYAKVGGKMAVSVMISYPDSSISSYAFLEGEPAVVDSAITGVTVRTGAEGDTSDGEGSGESSAQPTGVEAILGPGNSAMPDAAPDADGGTAATAEPAAPAADESDADGIGDINFFNF